jgi:hypothetical protein
MTFLPKFEIVTGTILVVGGVWQWIQGTHAQPVGPRAQVLRTAMLYQWGGLVLIGIADAAAFLPDLTRGILAAASIGCTVTGMVMRYRAPTLE